MKSGTGPGKDETDEKTPATRREGTRNEKAALVAQDRPIVGSKPEGDS
jgi:hypothetical protein